MDKNKQNVTNGGIGFAGLLTIVFIVLKLLGVINWSWWWVLSPLWISALLVLLILAVIFAVIIVFERIVRKKRNKKLLEKMKNG